MSGRKRAASGGDAKAKDAAPGGGGGGKRAKGKTGAPIREETVHDLDNYDSSAAAGAAAPDADHADDVAPVDAVDAPGVDGAAAAATVAGDAGPVDTGVSLDDVDLSQVAPDIHALSAAEKAEAAAAASAAAALSVAEKAEAAAASAAAAAPAAKPASLAAPAAQVVRGKSPARSTPLPPSQVPGALAPPVSSIVRGKSPARQSATDAAVAAAASSAGKAPAAAAAAAAAAEAPSTPKQAEAPASAAESATRRSASMSIATPGVNPPKQGQFARPAVPRPLSSHGQFKSNGDAAAAAAAASSSGPDTRMVMRGSSMARGGSVMRDASSARMGGALMTLNEKDYTQLDAAVLNTGLVPRVGNEDDQKFTIYTGMLPDHAKYIGTLVHAKRDYKIGKKSGVKWTVGDPRFKGRNLTLELPHCGVVFYHSLPTGHYPNGSETKKIQWPAASILEARSSAGVSIRAIGPSRDSEGCDPEMVKAMRLITEINFQHLRTGSKSFPKIRKSFLEFAYTMMEMQENKDGTWATKNDEEKEAAVTELEKKEPKKVDVWRDSWARNPKYVYYPFTRSEGVGDDAKSKAFPYTSAMQKPHPDLKCTMNVYVVNGFGERKNTEEEEKLQDAAIQADIDAARAEGPDWLADRKQESAGLRREWRKAVHAYIDRIKKERPGQEVPKEVDIRKMPLVTEYTEPATGAKVWRPLEIIEQVGLEKRNGYIMQIKIALKDRDLSPPAADTRPGLVVEMLLGRIICDNMAGGEHYSQPIDVPDEARPFMLNARAPEVVKYATTVSTALAKAPLPQKRK